jgi:glycosyltransferase involved in cell wall biosynthesis
MNHAKKVHVTFPVLNEEAQLEASILETLKFCEANQIENVALCIADNGSTDMTESIGRDLQNRFDKVTYIRLPQRGFGLALKTAWSDCNADYVGYMDLDLATDLKHFKQVYDLIQQEMPYTLFLGSRLKKGAKVEKRTRLREITSRCFNFWLRLNLNVGFSDGMCGFKFIEKDFYRQLTERFTFTDQWFFATELAVRAEWMGATILDLPVHWVDDLNSKSSIQLLRLTLQYLEGIKRLKQEKSKFFAAQKRS